MKIIRKIAWENLKKNRTRTIVTLIGIILSAAMFTAVTTSVSSIRHMFLERTYIVDGHYHSYGINYTDDEVNEIIGDENIKSYETMQQIGWAREENSKNAYKPYLYLLGVDESITDLVSVRITDGRFPENSNEILLPEHLKDNGKVTYEIGEEITLDVSERVSNTGERIENDNQYEEGYESLVYEFTNTYTVVGYYQRPNFEGYSAAGYSCLTGKDSSLSDGYYDVFVEFTDINKAESLSSSLLWDEYEGDHQGKTNSDLLRLSGATGDSNYNTVFWGLGSILVGIIMFGSVALIYNAFSISVNERIKQFGVLASIGATRRQIKNCVLTEGMYLALAGIPLGIIAGIIGMAITFHVTGNIIGEAFLEGGEITLKIYPSLLAVLLAALIAFLTIMISAYIPAKKALKKKPIDSIRQADQIQLNAKQVRVSTLTQKLFGFEGMLAAKNFKRNKKKYRATVFSIFVSMVLFISASSFSAYLQKSVGNIYTNTDYNIYASLTGNFEGSELPFDANEVLEDIRKTKNVEGADFALSIISIVTVNTDSLDASYLTEQEIDTSQKTTALSVNYLFINDDAFDRYCKDQKVSGNAIIVNSHMSYNTESSRYMTRNVFKTVPELNIIRPLKQEGFEFWYMTEEGGNVNLYYYDGINDSENEGVSMSPESAAEIFAQEDIALAEQAPFGSSTSSPTIVYPYSSFTEIYPEDERYVYTPAYVMNENDYISPAFYVSSSDHSSSAKELETYFKDLATGFTGNASVTVVDYEEEAEYERAMILVINIFSYGFIILISLIAIANIFNTISTNIELRKREIAMLRAVGLDPKGLRRMMSYECILYGIKGILYGLPASVIVTYLIYHTVTVGMDMTFFIPWYSVVIAVGSVFLIVFVTMVYATKKVTAGSTVDALKDETT